MQNELKYAPELYVGSGIFDGDMDCEVGGTCMNCIWKSAKFDNGCKRLQGTVNCATCTWHQTFAEAVASREKARQNFISKYGYDGYRAATNGKN